jgi:flagellar protein FliO/FliZ
MAAGQILLATSTTSGSATARIGSQAVNTPGVFGGLLALLLVLGLIVALAWLLKRLPGSGFRANAGMKLIASLILGPKERIVVVEVNGEQLLLGVSAGGISMLHHLSEPLPVTATTAATGALPDFARLLTHKRRKDG